MADLPERFVQRMKSLLSDEWDSFFMEARQVRQYGLRVNTLKISAEEFERIAPFHLTPVPWTEDGFYYEREDEPARHPFYGAGLYYLQEPSAMTPASRLKVKPGDRVLDLCAAPGGKATALAAGLKGQGFIIANDINKARARALLRNMELFGVTNSMVTNESPHILADRFPEYFDKIMVDAPCSGEGMFRKNPAVMDSWREKGPEYFSALQREIILHAADMLKPGGQMFYSTCTFAPEENEGVISHLLESRPEMEVIPMEDYEGFAPGILSFEGQDFHKDCVLCRRIWPHRMMGEGHFLALLRKRGEPDLAGDKDHSSSKQKEGDLFIPEGMSEREKKSRKKAKKDKKDKEAAAALQEFLSHVGRPDYVAGLDIRGEKVYYVADPSLAGLRLHFLRNGIYLGDLKKKRFEPSQPFALALAAGDYDQVIDFSARDEKIKRYLAGESIQVENQEGLKGWVLLSVEGYPLGWGKLAGSLLKNKYPVSWRFRQS